jgi:hypothetical protein
MGGSDNQDIQVTKESSWEDCCEVCTKNATCLGWTFFTDKTHTCHLHANQKDQNPAVANRITGLLTSHEEVEAGVRV